MKLKPSTIDFTDKTKQEVFRMLYLHGKLNKDCPPLRVKDVNDIARKCGNDTCTVLSPEEYTRLAEDNQEPPEAVLFIIKPNSEVGHFVGVYTDATNRIHYGDSFGNINEVAIHPKNRYIVRANAIVQATNASNCGYLALLYALTHNKMRPIDMNPL